MPESRAVFASRLARASLILVFCAVLLIGCGKRPSQVEPPPGGEAKPQIYPDVKTDPAP